MEPTCNTCKSSLRWLPENLDWACDACRRTYPPTVGRIRAEVCCQGPKANGAAYIGDLWLERDRVAFAATARVGNRFWGFLGAMAIGAIGGRGAARAAGGALWDYKPSLDKAGSVLLMVGEIASVTKLNRIWELRLVANPRGIDRVLVRPYFEWRLEHLRSRVQPVAVPPLPAPRWPRPVPSAVEIIGAPLSVFALALSDGLRERVQAADDERLLVLIVGALGVLAGIHSLVSLPRTPRGDVRAGRVFIALLLLGLAGGAVGRAVQAYTDPLPPLPERVYRF